MHRVPLGQWPRAGWAAMGPRASGSQDARCGHAASPASIETTLQAITASSPARRATLSNTVALAVHTNS